MPRPSGQKIVCQNRKARHDYFVEETFEAGLVLTGTEVKSLRAGRGSLNEAYAQSKNDAIWLVGFHIPPYEHGNIYNVDATRSRKLLLHRREIEKLSGMVSRKGYTIVPLAVYFKDGWAKAEIGLARGKQTHDKREDLKKREMAREVRRSRD